MPEANGDSRAGDGPGDRSLEGIGGSRGRHVDGFLEERAVERIRLVEEGQHVEQVMIEQTFERELASLDEIPR